MTSVDYAVVAILALSTLLAFLRGVVRELIAIASWVGGFIAAFSFGHTLATMLPGMESSPVLKEVLAFALILVGVLVAGTLIALVLSKLIRAIGLGFVDRLLGAAFGLARGLLLV